MNKEEIVEIIAAEHGIPKIKVNGMVRTFIRTVQEAVVRGDKVMLAGFGIFEAVDAPARMGHNPRTGEKVNIDATRRPKFVAGRTFKNAVRNGYIGSEDE